MKTYGDVDSKFRYVILASMRAKQLLRGAKARIKSRSKNPIRIAQEEMRQGLVDYEIVESKEQAFRVPEEEVFIGENIEEKVEKKAVVEETAAQSKPKKKEKEKEEQKKDKKPKKKAAEKPEEKAAKKPKKKAASKTEKKSEKSKKSKKT